jgi:Zn-dependent protease with chaperone function
MTSYRYPNESLILAVTLLLVLTVIGVTAVATLCGTFLFAALMLVITYFLNRSQHDELIQHALRVGTVNQPALSRLAGNCAARLQCGSYQLFIAPGRMLNAYTFGLVKPQVIVVYQAVLALMDEDELSFIIGHEMGHISLGHTWLNSLVGGMSGVPSPYMAAVLLYFSFRWWNRACEYSADRAGLLACGKPEKAYSALIKLVGGSAALHSAQAWQKAVNQIETEDDRLENNLGEMLSTHPLIVKRLQALRQFAASPEYRELAARVNAAKSFA